MKIGLDAMGGDFAPRENVEGALLAARRHGGSVVLIGDESQIQAELHKSRFSTQLIEVVHAKDAIGMHEKATASLRMRKETSIQVGLDLLKEDRIQAFISPGHTGALMSAATLTLKRLENVERPAIAGSIPTLNGNCVVLDLGANVECKPSYLVKFAMMGAVYAKVVEKKENPRVGLLSNGSEDSKGTDLLRQTNAYLKETNLNYIGFVESKDVFKGKVDVCVCDGFVGNIFLKTIEGLVSATATLIKRDIQRTLFTKMV